MTEMNGPPGPETVLFELVRDFKNFVDPGTVLGFSKIPGSGLSWSWIFQNVWSRSGPEFLNFSSVLVRSSVWVHGSVE